MEGVVERGEGRSLEGRVGGEVCKGSRKVLSTAWHCPWNNLLYGWRDEKG